MKKVANNLDPNAQRWVRNVEDSISNLEKLTAGLVESDRQNAVVVGSITQAVADIRAQQVQLARQQEILSINSSVDVYPINSRTTEGTTTTTVPISSKITDLFLQGMLGVVTFTLVPEVWASGAAGGAIQGSVQLRVNMPGGEYPANIIEQEVGADPMSASFHDVSFSVDIARAVDVIGFTGTTTVDFKEPTIGGAIGCVAMVTYRLYPQT